MLTNEETPHELGEAPAHESLAEALVASSVDGLLAFDRQCRYTLWNAAMERFTGVPASQAIGAHAFTLFPHLVEIGVDRLFHDALAGETTVVENYVVVGTGGSKRHFDRHYAPLRDQSGAVVGGVGVVREVTDRRLAEEALRESHERLRASQKMEAIGRLAGGVAHDFNNLLSVVLSCAEILVRGSPPGSPSQEHLAEIARAAERGAALTRQLLTFSRRQSSKPRVVDLNRIVLDLQTMLQRLIGEHITLTTALGDRVHVRADPAQLEQVILNLVLNARDALGDRGGTIRIATGESVLREPRDSVLPGRYAALRVEDDGAGMTDDVKAHLFEPFFTTKPRGKGTGLGLATVYGIVKQSAGHVAVRSAPGEGTSFEALFPLVNEAADAASAAVLATRARGDETILLVEDEGSLRRLLREVLTESGYVVIEAADGEEGLRACRERELRGERIDLLLTDVVMPGMSGRQLAARVREHNPDVGVLLMSGYDDDDVRSDEPVLSKPFSAGAVTRRVREVLDRKRG